jgi:hypothetical protein
MSAASGHAFTAVDKLYLALGWGYGQAAIHSLILFGSLLSLTAGHGTLYTAACPQVRPGGGGGVSRGLMRQTVASTEAATEAVAVGCPHLAHTR